MSARSHWSGEVNRTLTDLQNSILRLQQQPTEVSRLNIGLLPVGESRTVKLGEPDDGYDWATESLSDDVSSSYDATSRELTMTGVQESSGLTTTIAVPGGDPLEGNAYLNVVYDTTNSKLPYSFRAANNFKGRSVYPRFTSSGNYCWVPNWGQTVRCWSLDTHLELTNLRLDIPQGPTDSAGNPLKFRVLTVRILFPDPTDQSPSGNHVWGLVGYSYRSVLHPGSTTLYDDQVVEQGFFTWKRGQQPRLRVGVQSMYAQTNYGREFPNASIGADAARITAYTGVSFIRIGGSPVYAPYKNYRDTIINISGSYASPSFTSSTRTVAYRAEDRGLYSNFDIAYNSWSLFDRVDSDDLVLLGNGFEDGSGLTLGRAGTLLMVAPSPIGEEDNIQLAD